ncbi:hypothetical protein WJX74_005334 [Apatococcus lobatus]|uniref:chitinase n=1 Tax=Apatococcus lobatus TaxID=904363 RepID=A0AAW1RDH3_9CHLO
MYLDSRRHGLAFAISYLHWEPAQSVPQIPPMPSKIARAIAHPQEVASLLPGPAFREAIAHFKWATIMALSQVECGSYLEALANVRAAIPKLRQLAGVGVSYHDCEEIKDALGDMLALQATCQHALGDSAAAEQSARAALEQHPRDDRCITLLAQIKLGQGNRSSAVCLLQEAQQGYRVRPLQDLLENLNTHQDFLHQVLGSWRKSFYWYYSAGAPRESGPRVSLTPRRRLRSRRHDPKLLDYMPNGREFVYKPRDHVEPAWHALCGVAMLVGSLREVGKDVGGTRPETRAERRAQCMPKLPHRLQHDQTHSAGSFSTDGVGIHGDRRMNRTQQNRVTRLEGILTRLIGHAATRAQQTQAEPHQEATDDDGCERVPRYMSAGSSQLPVHARQPIDASCSTFKFRMADVASAKPKAAQMGAATFSTSPSMSAASTSAPASARTHVGLSSADYIGLPATTATATSTIHATESRLHHAQHQAAVQASNRGHAASSPIVSPAASKIVQQLLEGAGGVVATAAELAAAVRGSGTLLNVTSRRAPAQQSSAAVADSLGASSSNAKSHLGHIQKSSGSPEEQQESVPINLPQALALHDSYPGALLQSSGQQTAKGLDQPAAAGAHTAGSSSSSHAQQLQLPALHNDEQHSPRMVKLAVPGASNALSAGSPSDACQPNSSPAQLSGTVVASNGHPDPSRQQQTTTHASRRSPDLAQRVLQHVEGFVKANESLLPSLQMPSSMALAAATERAVRQLAAQKLLPNPEHSLQGRYHETRLLQRVEEEYLQAVSKRIWSIPHKFHSLRRISQHSNLCGRAYLSDSDDAGSDLVHTAFTHEKDLEENCRQIAPPIIQGCSCCNYPKPGSGPSSPAPASPASPGPKSPSPSPKAPSPPAPTAPSASGKVKSAYWGQGAASSTLASICGRYDLIFLSFLPNFGKGQDVTSTSAINIAGHSLTQTAADIRTCQGQGKKIILSLGGGVGNYGFSNTADAQSTAQSIWNAYLGGSGTNRPFGSIVLDGIDLDVEAPAGKQYYADFVKALKGLYKTGSRTFFLTAVPQCPFPDANLGPSLGTALGDTASSFDYVSIQFYNNPSCGGPNTVSGYLPWNSWAKSNGIKLLPTFPAAAKDAGSGYQDANAVAAELKQLSGDSTYGGWNLFTAEDDNNFSAQLPA